MSSVVGAQAPRIHVVPPYVSSAGEEALEVAAVAGLHLDPWEQLVLRDALGETPAGRWAAFRVGLEAPRQNGKGAILEARELAGLFAFGERVIVHSAHEQATASEHFERILRLMEGVPEFDRRILKVVRGKGSEAIKLRDNYRIFFKTRTGGGGRGFTGDLVVFDEAMILAAAFMAALVPLMAARSMEGDPQLWFAGSAVDEEKTDHGVEFSRVRADALKGVERLAYFGWNAPFDDPSAVPPEVLDDPAVWAVANPGLGIRISRQYIADERLALGDREFAVERLGIGAWPNPAQNGEQVIADDAWDALADPGSRRDGSVCFCFDVSPDRKHASVAVAGSREDGLRHVEIARSDTGTAWLVPYLVALAGRHDDAVFVCDDRGPAASLIPDLLNAGVEVETFNATEHSRACGALLDAVEERGFRHLGDPRLKAAIKGAAKRDLGDAFAWSRKSSSTDITPLVAATLALWGVESYIEDGLVMEVWG